MKRLYYLFLTLVSPAHNDEYNRLGEVEYLAKYGAIEWKEVEGEAVVKLQKHLHHI